LGALGPGPAGPLDKTALLQRNICSSSLTSHFDNSDNDYAGVK